LGQITTLTYTGNKITRVTDPFGRFATFEYLNDDLVKITDMGGYWTRLAYDPNHNLIKIEDDRGATSFKFEKADNNTNAAVYPAPDASMGFANRITVTDALNQKSEYFYGLYGYGWYVAPRDYVEYVDQNNNNYANNVPRTTYYYANTVKGQREEIKDIIKPEGDKILQTVDNATGLVLTSSDSYGNTTSYQYNAMGRVTYQKDPNGLETFYTYDPVNNTDLLTIQNSLGTITMTYDSHHRVTSITDIMGRYTGPIVYNSYGQVVSLTQAVQGQPNIVTQNIYDPGNHRLTRTEVNGKIVTEYTYDPIGRVQTSKNATGLVMTYEYNNLDQVTKVIYPDTKFTLNNYSTCCPRLLDSTIDRAGRMTRYYYDVLKRMIETINPEGGRQQYEYDSNGNLSKFIDPNGNATQYAYDLQNRLIKKTYADGKYYSYGYDKNGQLAWRRDSRGIRTDYGRSQGRSLLSLQIDNAMLNRFS
jgi:YD repeat-containing protein